MERKNYTQEEYDKANSVDLVALVKSLGYTLKRTGNNRLTIKEMDSVEIDPEANCFYRFSQTRGGGPVQFMETTLGVGTVEAVLRLCGAEYEAVSPKSGQDRQAEKPNAPFVLPKRAPHHRHVFAYLSRERKIAPEIISDMMHQKRLYETVLSRNGRDYYNCVFVGTNSDGKAVHAMTRFAREAEGRNPWWVIEGSDSLHPFAMEGKNDALYVYESAIDALSGATLDLMAGKDWRENHRIDLNGLSMKPLEQYLEEHPGVKRVVLCTDNDLHSVQKGEENHGQKAAKEMARHFRGLGYVVERRVPKVKDVNQALKEYAALLAAQAMDQGNEQEETEWVNEP